MKHPFRNLRTIVALFGLLTLAACGLATSEEDRIQRAEVQMADGKYRAAMIEVKNVLASNADHAAARLLLAKIYLGLGDLLSAEKELARAAELQAPEVDVQAVNLRILLAKGQFADVLAFLGADDNALTDAQRLEYRGEALLGLGSADTAKETYEKWLQSEPGSVPAKLGVSRAEFVLGNVEVAIRGLEALAQEAPDNHEVWQALGAAQFRSGDYVSAEAALVKAAELIRPQTDVPRYANILAGLVDTQLILGNKDRAAMSLDRLMGVAPSMPSSLFLAARLARSNGDYALASRHLQALLNVSPENGQAQLMLANVQIMQGNFAQAERLLHRVVAAAPDNILARKMLAHVQLRQSKPGGAIEALAPTLDRQTGDPDVYAILAQANLQQGDSESAIRQLRTAVEVAPNDVEAKLNLASAYYDAEQYALALELIEQTPEGAGESLRRERLLMHTLRALGRVGEAESVAATLLREGMPKELAVNVVAGYYIGAGQMNTARKTLADALRNGVESIASKNLLARLEIREGNFEAGHRLFSEVIDTDENNLVALVGLSAIAEQSGESAEMERLLKQAIEHHPETLGARVLLARKYIEDVNVDAAEKLANELVSIGFRNSYIHTVVADVFAGAGRIEDALFHYEQAAELNPESPAVQVSMARALLADGRTVEAHQALDRALALVPNSPEALVLLVLTELRQGRLQDAQRNVEALREAHPESVVGMILEGEVNLFRKDYASASRAFEMAVENGAGRSSLLRQYQAMERGVQPGSDETLRRWLVSNPDDVVVRTFLAQHYQTEGDGQRAIEEYEAVLQYAPDDATVLNNLAWQYQQEGDLQTALRLSERAYALDSESGSIADTLGWIYRDLGERNKSEELLLRASRLSPNNGEIAYHYAVVLADNGNRDQARELLEKLINQNVSFRSRKQAEKLLGEL